MCVKIIVQKAHAGFANTMDIAFQRHANICTITCSSFYDYLLKVQSKRLIFGWIISDFTRCHLGPLVLFILCRGRFPRNRKFRAKKTELVWGPPGFTWVKRLESTLMPSSSSLLLAACHPVAMVINWREVVALGAIQRQTSSFQSFNVQVSRPRSCLTHGSTIIKRWQMCPMVKKSKLNKQNKPVSLSSPCYHGKANYFCFIAPVQAGRD